MNVYAESSAVLAWLLEEAQAARMQEILGSAELVAASNLMMVECDRAFMRAEVLGQLSTLEARRRRTLLETASARWNLLGVEGTLERARQRFPEEPVRALDSIHLASALAARLVLPDLIFLSLDQRVRDNASALGFALLPE
jgi:predicted nucleic acid-binding protein